MNMIPSPHLATIELGYLINQTIKTIGSGKVFGASRRDENVSLPWIIEPAGSRPLNYKGTSPNNIALGSTVDVLSLTIPQGFDCVVKRLQLYYNGGGFVNNSGSFVITFLVDNSPYYNFESVTAEIGAINTLEEINGMRFYSGNNVTVQVTHVNDAALTESWICKLNGYYYPVSTR